MTTGIGQHPTGPPHGDQTPKPTGDHILKSTETKDQILKITETKGMTPPHSVIAAPITSPAHLAGMDHPTITLGDPLRGHLEDHLEDPLEDHLGDLLGGPPEDLQTRETITAALLTTIGARLDHAHPPRGATIRSSTTKTIQHLLKAKRTLLTPATRFKRTLLTPATRQLGT